MTVDGGSPMVKYEVRQEVRNINKSWLEVVFTTEFERVARSTYERCCTDHPNTCFELVKITTEIDCLAFVKSL